MQERKCINGIKDSIEKKLKLNVDISEPKVKCFIAELKVQCSYNKAYSYCRKTVKFVHATIFIQVVSLMYLRFSL